MRTRPARPVPAAVLLLAAVLGTTAAPAAPAPGASPPAPPAAGRSAPLPDPAKSDRLQKLLDDAIAAALAACAKESGTRDTIAATVIDLRDPNRPEAAGHRDDASYYPASCVKVCYMAATFQWAKEGRVVIDDAYRRDLRLMIGPSDNLATQRIVDRLCGTVDGPVLAGAEYDAFVQKRNAVNRWLRDGLGLRAVNACQKTYNGDEISPRDLVFLRGGKSEGPFTNRNAMTTRDLARLMAGIATDRVTDAAACGEMRRLMKRETGKGTIWIHSAAPAGATVWSKAGWVDNQCHDAGIVELPGGRRFVLVVFTNTPKVYTGRLIAEIARGVCAGIGK